jgi:hypothetical protein
MSKYHELQPKLGDVVLMCAHGIGVGTMFFKAVEPIQTFTPDGKEIMTEWLCCCDACFAEAGQEIARVQFKQHVVWGPPRPIIMAGS